MPRIRWVLFLGATAATGLGFCAYVHEASVWNVMDGSSESKEERVSDQVVGEWISEARESGTYYGLFLGPDANFVVVLFSSSSGSPPREIERIHGEWQQLRNHIVLSVQEGGSDRSSPKVISTASALLLEGVLRMDRGSYLLPGPRTDWQQMGRTYRRRTGLPKGEVPRIVYRTNEADGDAGR